MPDARTAHKPWIRPAVWPARSSCVPPNPSTHMGPQLPEWFRRLPDGAV